MKKLCRLRVCSSAQSQLKTLLWCAILSMGALAVLVLLWPTKNASTASRPPSSPPTVLLPESTSTPVHSGTLTAADWAFAHPQGDDGGVQTAPSRPQGALTDPPSASVPLARGEKMLVRGTVGTQTTEDLLPNQLGEFRRIYTKPGETVKFAVQLPEATPGERVVAAVEDGGRANGKLVQAFDLAADRTVRFEFVSGAEEGIYRISLRHGTQTKTLQVWAATHPELAINH